MQWLELIFAVLKFPQHFLALSKFLSKAPEEKRQEILERTKKEADEFAKTGRPKWG